MINITNNLKSDKALKAIFDSYPILFKKIPKI